MPIKDRPLYTPPNPPPMPRDQLPPALQELLDRQANHDRKVEPTVPAYDRAGDAANKAAFRRGGPSR